jgi:hypothetical protein
MIDATEHRHIDDAKAGVDAAMEHLAAAGVAHTKGDGRAVAAAHSRCRGALRSAQTAFDAMAKDSTTGKNSDQKIGGLDGPGTSSPPRAGHPLLHGDVAGWAARAFGKKAK